MKPLVAARRRSRLSLPDCTPLGNQLTLYQMTSSPQSVAGPSNSSGTEQCDLHSNSFKTASETKLIRLLSGDGITDYKFLDLLEKCTTCDKNFLDVYLREHIKICPETQDSDE